MLSYCYFSGLVIVLTEFFGNKFDPGKVAVECGVYSDSLPNYWPGLHADVSMSRHVPGSKSQFVVDTLGMQC